MMNKPSIRIEFSSTFKKDIKRLGKKYRNIRTDIDGFTDQLKDGETPGDQLQRAQYTIYKARVRNSDLSRGKSGGYRIIYYIKMIHLIVLVTMYTKSEQDTISLEQIQRIIDEYEKKPPT
jgi:mRNA-degrading endonuclease RelE of RelBE toxin-antitoxin system